jgi:hypothetical protein
MDKKFEEVSIVRKNGVYVGLSHCGPLGEGEGEGGSFLGDDDGKGLEFLVGLIRRGGYEGIVKVYDMDEERAYELPRARIELVIEVDGVCDARTRYVDVFDEDWCRMGKVCRERVLRDYWELEAMELVDGGAFLHGGGNEIAMLSGLGEQIPAVRAAHVAQGDYKYCIFAVGSTGVRTEVGQSYSPEGCMEKFRRSEHSGGDFTIEVVVSP